MIHAFFNIRLDETYLAERTGQVVRDLDEVRAVACTIIRRLVVQHGGEPRLLNAVMAVTDAAGASILDLSFFEALYVPVAAPERAGADRARAVLGRGAVRMPGRVGGQAFGQAFGQRFGRVAAFAALAARTDLAARIRTLTMRPRLGAALLPLHRHLAALADLLSFRRDPRQRFTLPLEAGG